MSTFENNSDLLAFLEKDLATEPSLAPEGVKEGAPGDYSREIEALQLEMDIKEIKSISLKLGVPEAWSYHTFLREDGGLGVYISKSGSVSEPCQDRYLRVVTTDEHRQSADERMAYLEDYIIDLETGSLRVYRGIAHGNLRKLQIPDSGPQLVCKRGDGLSFAYGKDYNPLLPCPMSPEVSTEEINQQRQDSVILLDILRKLDTSVSEEYREAYEQR